MVQKNKIALDVRKALDKLGAFEKPNPKKGIFEDYTIEDYKDVFAEINDILGDSGY